MHIWPFCVSRWLTLVTAGLRDETKLAGETPYAGFQIYLTNEIVLGQSPSECQHYLFRRRKMKPNTMAGTAANIARETPDQRARRSRPTIRARSFW